MAEEIDTEQGETEYREFWDDLSGARLDPEGVRQARREEMSAQAQSIRESAKQ